CTNKLSISSSPPPIPPSLPLLSIRNPVSILPTMTLLHFLAQKTPTSQFFLSMQLSLFRLNSLVLRKFRPYRPPFVQFPINPTFAVPSSERKCSTSSPLASIFSPSSTTTLRSSPPPSPTSNPPLIT
ncbi:hypothetical protein F2P56_010108, partial [Juglans regia]